MRTKGWLPGIVCAVVCSAAMARVETFESGLSGFEEGSISAEVIHTAGGGNPGSPMLMRRVLANPGRMGSRAPTNATFIGDYAAAGIGGMAVDLNFGADNVTGAFFRMPPDVSGNGWRRALVRGLDGLRGLGRNLDHRPKHRRDRGCG